MSRTSKFARRIYSFRNWFAKLLALDVEDIFGLQGRRGWRRRGYSGRELLCHPRLEALEDLYEGANDRVADYRWYRSGAWLEIGIIILLIIETVMISFDFYMRR